MASTIEYDFTKPEYIYRDNLIDPELELFRYNILNSFTVKLCNRIKYTIKRDLVYRERFKVSTYLGQLLINQISSVTYNQPKTVVFDDSLILIPSKSVIADFYSNINNLFADKTTGNKLLFNNDDLSIYKDFGILHSRVVQFKKMLKGRKHNSPLTKFTKHIAGKDITYSLKFNKSSKFKIHEKVYDKMKNMYSGNIDEFDLYVLCGIIRYESLNSGANQYVLNLEWKELARQNFGVNFELFASMFNNYYDNYCSLFYDLEQYFGSHGSAFAIKLNSGLYFSNPPFDDNVMTKMYGIIKKYMSPSVLFIANMPKWDDYHLQDLIDKEKLYKQKWFIYETFLNPYKQEQVDIPPNYIYLFANNNFSNKKLVKDIARFIDVFYKDKITTSEQYTKYKTEKYNKITQKKHNQLLRKNSVRANKTHKKSKTTQTAKKKKTNITTPITKQQFDNLDFPYYSYYTTVDQIKLDFERLKTFRPIIRTNDYNKKLEPLTINGKRYKNYVILENYKRYYLLHKITDFFSQRCRVLCEFRYPGGSRLNELQAFEKHKNEIYANVIKDYNTVNYLNIEEYLYNTYKRCTLFKITVSLAILQLFKPKVWIDISSGWGDRLISAIAYGKCKYYGTDPSECQQSNYKKIIDTFVPPKDRINYKIQKIGYEKNTYPANSADLIWSGPPFFDLEIYEHTNNQSHEKYNTFDSWVNDFLYRDVIQKSVPILQVGGHLVLYINDYAHYKYTTHIRDRVKKEIPNLKYRGKIYYTDVNDNKKNYREFHVWQKV